MCYAAPGPRCSNHAMKALNAARVEYTLALKSNDADACIKAQEELNEAENNYYMTPKGQSELRTLIEETGDPDGDLANKLDYGIVAREQAIKQAKVADIGDVNTSHEKKEDTLTEAEAAARLEELNSAVKERVEAEEFVALIAERDRTRAERKALQAEIQEQKEKLEQLETTAEGKPQKRGEEKPTEEEIIAAQDALDEEYEKFRELNDKHLDAFYAYHVANNELEQYKNETALLVAEMNDIQGDPGIPFEGDKLGNAIPVASYDSGTREWLEERQKGIGGSDVGSMLKLDPEFGTENFSEFVKSKTEKYSEEEVAAQAEANSGFSGPTGRGNAWEPAIVRRYAEENPDMNVMYSKTSWANEENPHHKLNVDGLLSSDGVTPDGILEIKTASDISHWEHVNEDGSIEERVPLGYRAQVLWYLNNTGFKYADIAVMVDDREYRSRRIYADEAINPYDRDEEGNPAVGTMDQAMPKIQQVWQSEVVARWNGTKESRNPKSTFDKAAAAANIHGQAVQLAAWRQIEVSEAKNIILSHRKEETQYKKALGDGYDDTTMGMDARMRAEYAKGGPTTWTKDLVSVDIETSGMAPNSGEIIEIGIRRTRPDGTIVEEYEERFGVRDERTLDILGTGAQEVHKIAPDDIRGKRSFQHPEVQAKVKSLLMDDNAVMVAHNKMFEERWFDQYVPGFNRHRARLTSARFKAQREGKKHPEPKAIMDTMFHSRYLTPDSENNRLATFTVANGIPYEDAHSALPDAQMTDRAVRNHDRRLRGVPIINEIKEKK